MKMKATIVSALAFGHLFIGISGLAGGEHIRLEDGIPLEIGEAYPTGYRNREVQAIGRYERTRDGEDLWLVESRLEYGFARNWEASLSVPFEFGEGAMDEGIQDVGVEALYNFNSEGRYLPALSLSGGLHIPTAGDSRGADTEVMFLATKSIGWTDLFQRVHLNLSWLRNAGSEPGERENRYRAVAGYDIRTGPDTLLLADLVWEQETERGVDAILAEVGVRRMINPLTAVGVGVGAGLNNESPDIRATIGLQKSF